VEMQGRDKACINIIYEMNRRRGRKGRSRRAKGGREYLEFRLLTARVSRGLGQRRLVLVVLPRRGPP
jgi:hypothetical protein